MQVYGEQENLRCVLLKGDLAMLRLNVSHERHVAYVAWQTVVELHESCQRINQVRGLVFRGCVE